MHNKQTILAVCTVAVLLTIFGGVSANAALFDRKGSNFKEDRVLYVYPQMSADDVLDSLSRSVRRPRSLVRAFRHENVTDRIKPGKYMFKQGSSSVSAARTLNLGWQAPHNLTFSGTIRTRSRIVRQISAQMMVDSATVADSLSSNEFLSQFGVDTLTLFMLILPDTYSVCWTDDITSIMKRMKREWNAFWTPERDAMAAAMHLTRQQVTTLASIVQGESQKEAEYPVIAGVYLNRLNKGMRLQADPTVAYCWGYQPRRILRMHLEVDSPYNTYKYAGLPPTPIMVPCKACIDGVLDHAEHKYLYFCASPAFDGTHRFAASYAEHQKNAREFQRALNERNFK